MVDLVETDREFVKGKESFNQHQMQDFNHTDRLIAKQVMVEPIKNDSANKKQNTTA
jgi:hypothetical protein